MGPRRRAVPGLALRLHRSSPVRRGAEGQDRGGDGSRSAGGDDPGGAEGMELVHGSTALIAEYPEAFARAVVRLCTDHVLHARLSRNGLEHARARWDPAVVAPKLLETLARMPTLRTKRLRTVDRVRVRARATYDSSGVPARFNRLSSLRRWYYGRLREVLTRGIR